MALAKQYILCCVDRVRASGMILVRGRLEALSWQGVMVGVSAGFYLFIHSCK